MSLEYADDVAEAWKIYRSDKSQVFQIATVHDRAQKLIDFLLRAFPGDPSPAAEIRAIVESTENYLHSDVLNKIPDEMVPFAVVMSIVRHHRVLLNPTKVNNWSVLMKRYNFLSV